MPKSVTQLWSVGASFGTSFKEPLLIGTLQGTLAPFKSSFFMIGADAGFMTTFESTSYYSAYPFVNYAYFLPFATIAGRQETKGGWYIGAGGGYLISKYKFDEGTEYSFNSMAMNFVTGFNIAGWLDVSYTMRTNFDFANSKLSVGYVYRF